MKLIFVFLFLVSVCFSNDYEDALKAYKNNDRKLGLKLLRKSAIDNNNPKAQLQLAVLYMNNMRKKDAHYMANKASSQNYLKANLLLGTWYQYGIGIEENKAKAFELYKKVADTGDREGIGRLGNMYYFGSYVKQNTNEAIRLYTIASNKGHLASMDTLAGIYLTKNQLRKSASLFKKAAELGYTDSQVELGAMYRKGLGVLKDYRKSVYWYEKAIEKDNIDALCDITYSLAKLKDSEKSMRKAKKYVERAYEIYPTNKCKAVWEVFKLYNY